MAQDIHPNLNPINVKCSGCGNTFQVHTTLKDAALDIEICYKCHPAYTGKRRASSSGHGVEAFNKRFGAFSSLTSVSADSKK